MCLWCCWKGFDEQDLMVLYYTILNSWWQQVVLWIVQSLGCERSKVMLVSS